MPPKRKISLSEKDPSFKRVRIASPTPLTHPSRSPGVQDTIEVSTPLAGTEVPVKRGPGRPRKNPLALVAPRARGKVGPKKITTTTVPTPTPRKGRSAQQRQELDVASDDAEGEEDTDLLSLIIDPLVINTEITTGSKDVFSPPAGSSDELTTSALATRVNPTPRRRAVRKPRITYKSRRSSLLSRDDPASSGSEADPISITKSSPIIASKKSVPIPSTPATMIKPRGRPPRARKKGAPEVPESVNVAPMAVMEVTPSAVTRGRGRLSYGSLHETDAEGEDDDMMDEDIIIGDGTITALASVVAAPKDVRKGRANRRRSLPSPVKKIVMLDGVVDPFALSEGDGVEQNGAVVAEQQEFSVKALKGLKKRIMGKLTGRKPCKLVGVAEEEMHVRNLLEQTVTAGEGNSMLVIGARGSGKTTLVETAISDLREEHASEFLVVRLNGFLQTDDRIALREIWRQLGVEMELDEKDQPKTNFADTLSSILAILSHPDELKAPGEDDTGPDNNTTTLSVIFLLEEFDLFAGHPRQTLLYNLFDIAQSRKAPIAVIGTTTRIDVTETLEKRVKSRFSHRTVHLRNPATLGSFWAVCKEGLGVDMDALDAEITVSEEERACCEAWNAHIERLYKEDKPFQRVLKRVFAQSKDVKSFFNACILPVASLASATGFPASADFVSVATSLAEPDSILSILDGLTDLELTLLISAARLDIISDTDMCNFSMAYDEYVRLTSSLKVQNSVGGVTAGRLWSKEVALGAWERLGEYGILTSAVLGAAGGQGRQGGMGSEGRMWRVEVGLGEIGGCLEKGGAGQGRAGLAKWCREV